MVSQRRIYLSLVSFLIIVLNCWPVASAKRVERTQAQHYLEHVKFLAGPELQGRGAGTPGLERVPSTSRISSGSSVCARPARQVLTSSRSK